jgi:glycosyltransferase involved in cell wall biosynthesis
LVEANSKLKILHVGPVKIDEASSGPTQSIKGLVAAQAQSGMDVGLLTTIPSPEGVFSLNRQTVKFFSVLPVHLNNPWGLSKTQYQNILENFGKPDLVHFHSTYIPFNIALARNSGWPYCVTPRGGLNQTAQEIKRWKKLPANILFFKKYLQKAKAIHALSQNEAEEISRWVPRDKIFVVPNGVEESILEQSIQSLPAELNGFKENDTLLVGFVGRIDVYTKGLDLFLKALSEVNRSASEKRYRYKFLLVGPFYTPKDENLLLKMIDELNLNDRIFLAGPSYGQRKWDLLGACDLFVLTSRSEGMPMSVLEAMALGKACLVTPQTNMAEFVRRGGGWVCDCSVEGIGRSLKEILDSPEKIKEAERESKNIIKSQFLWPHIAAQMEAEYEKVLKP